MFLQRNRKIYPRSITKYHSLTSSLMNVICDNASVNSKIYVCKFFHSLTKKQMTYHFRIFPYMIHI